MVVEGLLLWWQEAESLTAWQKENGDCFCIIGDELGVSQNGCFRTFFQIVFLTLASDLARFLCYMWLSRPSDEHLGPVLEASQGSVIWCIFPGAEPQVSLSGICKACPPPPPREPHLSDASANFVFFLPL